MKGIFTDIGFTVAVLITAVIVILAMLVLFVIFEFKGKDPMSYSLDFVDLSNKPYMLSGGLLHLKIDDRQFIEHAIEASVVGSFESSGYEALHDKLNEFLDKYDLEYYGVEIKGDNTVLNLNNGPLRCGPAEANGYCSSFCDVGQVEIPGGNSDCGSGYCCDFNPDKYIEEGGQYEIYICGSYDNGICSMGPVCGSAMIELEEGNEECNTFDVNHGQTLICCAPKTSENVIITGYATSAEIPLFYRDKFSSMVVTISE